MTDDRTQQPEAAQPTAGPGIPTTRRLVRAARRRLRRRAGVDAAGVTMVVAGSLGLGLSLVGWWMVWGWPWWVYPAGVVVSAAMMGLGVGASRRVSAVRAAGVLDDELGLADRLSSAVEFVGGRCEGFTSLAIADAERVAGEARAPRAVPIGFGRGWTVGGVLVLAMVGLGVGLPDRAGVVAERKAAQQERRFEAADRISEARQAVEELLLDESEGEPGVNSPEDEGTLRTFEELERELESGNTDPEEALARAAADLEEQAAQREAEGDSERERAETLEERLEALDSAEYEHAQDLASRLEEGDLEGAREAARELLDKAQRAEPSERERIAEELDRLADALKESPGGESEDEPASSPESDPRQTSEQKPSEELSDALEREADRMRDQPNDQQDEQPGDPQGEQPSEQQGEQPGDQQGDQPNDQQDEQPGDPQGEQPSEQQGEQPGDQQGEQPSEQQGEQSGDQQGEQPNDQQDEQPGDPQGEQPSDQQGEQPGDQQGDQPSEQQGEQPGDQQGDQPSEQQGEQPGDQQGDQPSEQQDEQPGDQQGERPSEQQGDQTGDQQDEQPGEPGTEPGGENEQRPGSLEEALREAGEARDRAEKSQQEADELRRQADRLLDRDQEENPDQNPGDQPGGTTRPDSWSRALERERGEEPGTGGEGELGDPGPPADDRPFEQTEPVDARSENPEGQGRVISEWMGEGREGASSPKAQRQMRDAVKSAERAVEQQRVPTRHRDLIRRVFRQWEQRAAGETVAPLGEDAVPSGSGGVGDGSGGDGGL